MLKPEQLAALANSSEFQSLLKSDDVIAELERSKESAPAEYENLLDILSIPSSLHGCPVRLSPAVWGFLWVSESPYARGKHPTDKDTDRALFLLVNGIKTQNSETDGFCQKLGISCAEADRAIRWLIFRTFYPLNMLPPAPSDGSGAKFDSLWLADIVSKTARMTNYPADHVAHKMSLSACFYYTLVHVRENSAKNTVRSRTTSEIDSRIYKRTMELGAQFCKEHNL